eukprot:1092108_1
MDKLLVFQNKKIPNKLLGIKMIQKNFQLHIFIIQGGKINSSVAKDQAIKTCKSLHPVHHSNKLTNFTKFADFIHKADDQTTTGQIVQKVSDYWNPYHGTCDNPLGSIGGDTAQQMLEKARHQIQKESQRMFCDNFKTQFAVIVVQYVLLWYLWEESKRTDKVIESALNRLKQIKEDYIDPALHLMYIDSADPMQEMKTSDRKYRQFNHNLNADQYKLVEVYLNHALDRLEDSMDLLEDKKKGAMIHGVVGCVATVASAFFTAGLGSGFASLYGSVAMRGTALCAQQGVFTAASSAATVGFVGVTVKHGWNYKRCEELLDEMKELKKEIDREKRVLEENMQITSQITRNK